MSNPGPVSVASDTDESEQSNYSEDENEPEDGAPLIQSISDSESENEHSGNDKNGVNAERKGMDGDDDDDEEEKDSDSDEAKEEEGSHKENDSDDDEEEKLPKPKPEFPKIIDEFTDATPLTCIQTERAEDYEWKELCLARVSLLGTPETGMQAIISQFQNGAESGCADKSVSRNQTTKDRIKESYVMVEQPMGYIIRVTGYHAQPGTPCLLHSLKLQFASGQVMELQGTTDSYKGEPFIVEGLDDHFYFSNLEFQEGKCIGYSGYTTERPVYEIMEEASLPDEEMLKDTLEDSEHGGNDPFNPQSNSNKNNNRNNPNANSANPNNSNPNAENTGNNMSPPPANDGAPWYDESLPAVVLPRPDGDEKSWRIAHVCLLGDLGLRGCILHYYDGKRYGFLQRKDLRQTHVYDYEEIEESGGEFIQVQQPGGHIKKINGYHMSNEASRFLCNSLQLEFASGQVIDFAGELDAGKGRYFSYSAPDDFYIHQIRFNGEGKLSSVAGIRLDDMDCPPMDVPEVQTKPKKKCCCCF